MADIVASDSVTALQGILLGRWASLGRSLALFTCSLSLLFEDREDDDDAVAAS